MVCRQPEYNRAFRCLGGACPDTCCRDWEIMVDEGALADYQAAPAGLRAALADALAPDGEGEVCFRLRPDGFCALLTPEGLCTIQRDWGEAHLCAHCAAYPRFTEEYGCLTETALAVSCPQAARLLMEAADFALEEGDDGGREPPFDGVEAELLAALEPEYVTLSDTFLEVYWPLGTLPSADTAWGAAVEYAQLGELLYPWAVPEAPEP